jgi:magnesium transporter
METLTSLVRSFVETHPEGAARALEALSPEEAARVLVLLPAKAVGPVVERLTPYAAGAVLSHLTSEHTQALLEEMTYRQAALVLQHLDEERRQRALEKLSATAAAALRELLRYSAETAGGIMEPQVTSIAVDLTAQEAIEILHRAPRQTLYYLYVTDRDGKLVGILQMRDLLLAQPADPIASLISQEVLTVPATLDREEVTTLMRQQRFLALPVVDEDGRLLGVVKYDRALDTAQQEAFEDLQKLVGAGGDERALSPVPVVVRKRLPWLYVNLLTAFLASAVVGLFESTLAAMTALAVLLPIVSGQGGNSGSQTLAVVIRGLALREILPGSVRRVILKELLAAAINGLAIAAVTAAAVYLWSGDWRVSAVIGLAMLLNMTIAGLAGAAIPLVLRRLGRDPAQSSSIFLTTVTDTVGFASFLGLATMLLPLLA